MIRRVILPEIAAEHHRPEGTLRHWMANYPWPEPAGTRGRYDEYDADEVAAAIAAIIALPDFGDGADPDELLDMRQAAAEAGISYGTLRGYVSRGKGERYWPKPDDDSHGVKRWKRSTVRAQMAARRPREGRGAEGPR